MPPPPPLMRPPTSGGVVGAPTSNTTNNTGGTRAPGSRPPSAPPSKRPPPSAPPGATSAGPPGNNNTGAIQRPPSSGVPVTSPPPSSTSRPPPPVVVGGKGPQSIPDSPRPMSPLTSPLPVAPSSGQSTNYPSTVNAVGPKSSPPPPSSAGGGARPPFQHTAVGNNTPQSSQGGAAPPSTTFTVPNKVLSPPPPQQQASQPAATTTTHSAAKVTSSYHLCPFKARDHRVEVMFEVGDGRPLMRPSEVFAHSIGHADELHLQSLADPNAVGGPKSSSRTSSENRMPSINYADYLSMVSARDGSADVAIQRTKKIFWEYLSQTVDHQINMDQIWVRFEPGEIKTVGLGTCGRGSDSIVGDSAPRLQSSRKTNPVLLRDCNWPIRVYAQVLCAHRDAAPIMSSLQQLGLPLLPPPHDTTPPVNGGTSSGDTSPPQQPHHQQQQHHDVTCRAYQDEWLFDRFTHHIKGSGTASPLELEVLRAQGYPHNSKDVRDQQRSVKKRQLDASGATIEEVDSMMKNAKMDMNNNHLSNAECEDDLATKRRSYYTRRRKLHEKQQQKDDDAMESGGGTTTSMSDAGGVTSRTQSVLSTSSTSQKPTPMLMNVTRDCFHNRASVVFFDLLKFLQERTKRPVFQHAHVDIIDTGRLRRTAAQQPDDEDYDFDVSHGCNAAVRMPFVVPGGSNDDGATFVFSVAPRKERTSHRTSFYSHDISSVTPLMDPVVVHTGASSSSSPPLNSNITNNTKMIASTSARTASRSPPFQHQHSRLAIEDTSSLPARHGSYRGGAGGDRPTPSNVHLNGRCQHNFNVRSASAGRSISPEVAAYHQQNRQYPATASHHHQPQRGGVAAGVTQSDTRYAKGGIGYSVLDNSRRINQQYQNNVRDRHHGVEPFQRNPSSDSRRSNGAADVAGEVQVIGVRSISAPRIRPTHQQQPHYKIGRW